MDQSETARLTGTERTEIDEVSRSLRSEPELARGQAVGRFAVLEEVGRGAMGVVYAAYDPELDRRIALKLLHGSHGQDRLIREARALARFTHANVVTIHDVGIARGRGFIATEFIDGQTLREWLEQQPRSVDEILEALRAAGRGLAAAHQAGVVHRDFKPHNVMITREGRVVVMDFGLARSVGDSVELSASGGTSEPSTPAPEQLGSEATQLSNLNLTATGTVLGTPAYMSLEQHRGRPADAASDQFSFCVTLFEALVGRRPFEGNNRMAIAQAIGRGQRRAWAGDQAIPTRVKRAIERGLAAKPADRWPSMEVLLAELEPEAPRRLGPLALALGGIGLVASGVVGFWLAQRPSTPCAEVGEAAIAEVWGPTARERLDAAIRGTRLSYADETAERVLAQLDAYAERWTAARHEVCVAHQIDHIQTDQVHDARVRCLERSVLELDALVDALSAADARMVGRATDAVFNLPAIDRCADVDALLDEVPPPDDPRAAKAVEAARRALVEADAQRMAGELAEASVRLERARALAEADAAGYRPVFAELALAEGSLRIDQGRFPEAAEALERAHLDARRSGHRNVAIRSAITLVYIAGYRLARYEQAELWARLAHAEADRVGPSTPAHAELLSREGILHGRQGRFVEARDHYLRAKALYEELGATDNPGYDAMFTNLGLVRLNLGEIALAHQHLVEALRRNQARYGASHPKVAAALTNLASATLQLGELDDALGKAHEAVRLAESSLAADHVGIGHAHAALALAALANGDLDTASRSVERAYEIQAAALGPEHPAVAEVLAQRAELLRVRGRVDEAVRDAGLARERLSQRFGEADPRTAEATSVLALATHATGDQVGAAELARSVLDQLERGAPRASLPRGRAWLVLAAVEPESASAHASEARAELEAAGGLGAHLAASLR